jgi:hypothetical protein
MQLLLLPLLEIESPQTCSVSGYQPRDFVSPIQGRILADRYKILKVIDQGSFKGHDLALDQTVNVRQALCASQRDRDIWRQKARELMAVRNSNFLNVIDLICDESGDFVISEHPRGRLIAELAAGRTPLALDDVLALMRPVVDALDLIARSGISWVFFSARSVYTEVNRSSFAPCQKSGPHCELPHSAPFLLNLDVWELVKPRKGIWSSLVASETRKANLGKFAVCQVALLTYELLGGQSRQAIGCLFEPIKQLGKFSNTILYSGLRGASVFENAKDFFLKLESAIRRESNEKYSQGAKARRTCMAYSGMSDRFRRFNRDTTRVAIGLLSAVVCASLLFAVSMPELRSDTRQNETRPGPALNAHAAPPPRILLLKTEKPEGLESAADQDQQSGSMLLKQNVVDTQTSAEPTPFSAVILRPEIRLVSAKPDRSNRSPTHRRAYAPAITEKIERKRYRLPDRSRTLDVQMQLIALWHKSLHQSGRPRSSVLFSNP